MTNELPVNGNIIEFIPAIRMLLSDNSLKVARLQYNSLNKPFCSDRRKFNELNIPEVFSYWDGTFIFIDDTSSPDVIIKSFIKELADFKSAHSVTPKIIVIKDYGILAVDENSHLVSNLHSEIEEALAIVSKHSKSDSSSKQKQAKNSKNPHNSNIGGLPAESILNQKICVVTGGAQGFGEGISRSLIAQNANLVIADLNEEKGLATTNELADLCNTNEIFFAKTDVSSPDSVKNLIVQTVKNFGGIDVFVSNAGILKAGGLEEMDPASFELMTKINYEGYFLSAKYSSAVMKLQSKYKEDYYADIIQINSKSGLKGSNRNFAYSGGKFGGIGLTQSFAMELAPFRIKVNAICPGNFFEGPLWSDPDKGLFVQYLKAGKVSGAKTIEDVRRYYEKQVPMGRGCRVQDVMKALVYIVTQEYETGQAVPVTGGQEMLS
jgi:NAD(P)-dependent dehydrogenase (short-subunit alcohol dehydrogenase family)